MEANATRSARRRHPGRGPGQSIAGLLGRGAAPAFGVARVFLAVVSVGLTVSPIVATAQAGTRLDCPSDLSHWKQLLGAEWLDCHRMSDLTTTSNPWTDPNDLTGMGAPPPGSGTLDSRYTNPTSPAVPGVQIDGYWSDGCNAFQSEPVTTNKNGQPWIPGCTPAVPSYRTCLSGCHHDGQFVIRIPDTWNGHLVTAGTPGIRDAFASDFVFSDFAMEKGWAYVSQDKGNMGSNFYQDGADELGFCRALWCPAAAIQEWTARMRQATSAAKALLDAVAPSYGLRRVTRSYAVGISNGGYQVRRALETDAGAGKLYDGGVDWEGTFFSNQENLLSYLPTSLAEYPGNVLGDSSAVQAMAAVGFNPASQPLWSYHWSVYWGLTQKIYRLEFDPEYTGYTCSSTSGLGPPCVSAPAEQVPPGDPDATYSYRSRVAALPALSSRMQSVATTGDIHAPLITLQGDQDSLLPIKTDADLYAGLVAARGHSGIYRYYPVAGGNHVDPQFDDHYGIDSYGSNTLRPMLPCVWAAVDALDTWVVHRTVPPGSHTIPRPAGASAEQLANQCSLAVGVAPQIPPGGSPAALRIAITTSNARISGGRTRVRLRCAGGGPHAVCRGRLRLLTASKHRVRRRIHGHLRIFTVTHMRVIADARYAVTTNHSTVVELRLAASWVAGASRAHRSRWHVRGRATLKGGHAASRVLVLRFPILRRHHARPALTATRDRPKQPSA